MSDLNEAGAKRLWQSQPEEIPTMSTIYLQHRARELDRAVRIRDFTEQSACAMGLIACTFIVFTADHIWLRGAMGLLIVGIGYAMFQWRRRIHRHAGSATTDTGLAFYVRELEHKRDLHRTLWRWYVLPIIPGTLAMLSWSFFGDPNTRGTVTPWLLTGLVVAWTTGALIYERAKAAQYQREIDALAAKEPKPSVPGRD